MTKDEAIAFVRALGARSTGFRKGWVTCSCPLAPFAGSGHRHGTDRKPSFAVQVVDNDESHYHCFTCGGGDLVSLVMQIRRGGGGRPKYQIREAMRMAVRDGERKVSLTIKDEIGASPEDDGLPEVRMSEHWLASLPKASEIRHSYRYLRGRGCSRAMADWLGLRYDMTLPGVVFPVRDWDGTLRQFRARLIPPNDGYPYHVYPDRYGRMHPTVWFGEWWLDLDQPVVMVESLFDVLAILPMYTNVCAPMYSGVSPEKVLRMREATDIIAFFDDDPAGLKCRRRVEFYLRRAHITHLYPEEPAKDPGEMPREQLRELLAAHVRLR